MIPEGSPPALSVERSQGEQYSTFVAFGARGRCAEADDARTQQPADRPGTLSISTSTVKKHVRRIIAKLGVSDRTRAAVRAIELGLVLSVVHG